MIYQREHKKTSTAGIHQQAHTLSNSKPGLHVYQRLLLSANLELFLKT